MIISLAIEKMINFYQGNIHDINHFLKVYGFAKTIGEQENLDALPERCDMPEGWSPTDMDRMVHQILLEADYLVNADEGGKSKEGISSALTKLFHTRSGKRLLRSVYRIP